MKKLIIISILCAVCLAVKAPEAHIFNIFRPKPTMQHPAKWIQAIVFIESQSGTYNKREPLAQGILQQYPIFVRDVNRILGKKKYSLDDRNDPAKALEMFMIYQYHYNPKMNFERMCRLQSGGPDGYKQSCTDNYYHLVRDKLYSTFYK
jgi:hypothetical protein